MTNLQSSHDADRRNAARRFNLSQEDLDEFKAIWKKEFNEELSDDRVLEEATKLLTLFRHLAKD